MDTRLQQYILQIEESLLDQIIADLREGKMILGEAKYLAKDFLALLPVKSKEELLDKLYNLKQTYPQARKVFGNYFQRFEEEKTAQRLAILRRSMQQKDYEHALENSWEVDYHG